MGDKVTVEQGTAKNLPSISARLTLETNLRRQTKVVRGNVPRRERRLRLGGRVLLGWRDFLVHRIHQIGQEFVRVALLVPHKLVRLAIHGHLDGLGIRGSRKRSLLQSHGDITHSTSQWGIVVVVVVVADTDLVQA